jgi:hypothetical protein
MNSAKCVLLFVVCLAAFFAIACSSSRKLAPGSSNVKVEPQLIMFGGWQTGDKGIYLAKSDVGSEDRIYFALAKPNGEPVIDNNAPKMEINIGKNLYLSGANIGGKYAQVTTKKDDSGKITEAKAYVAYSRSNQGETMYYDLEPIEHTIHGWSSNDVYVAVSAEGKKVLVLDGHAGGQADVKLKNITSFKQVALAADKRGFYVVGDTELPGFGIEYIDFNNVKFKKEKSVSILNVPKPQDAQATFRAIISPDQKTLALLTNTHRGGDGDFHPNAENKLSLYDLPSGQMTREYNLPNGGADLRNMLFVSGPWWRGDNRAIGFDLRPSPEQKTFYTIDLSTGEITNWFTAGDNSLK